MTAFVTGADGFLGRELVKVLIAEGHSVAALTPSPEAAESMRRFGARPVVGDPSMPGRWQDEAAAQWVFHIPPQLFERSGVRRTRVAAGASHRAVLDANLLDAVTPGPTRRIVYVADGSCYGAAGPRPVTEDEPLRPSPLGRGLLPVLDRLEGYVLAGWPIVTAIPGWVYGNGSWFRERIVDPILAGRRIVQFGARGARVSPIHVRDFGRALVHLAWRGECGGRYFVANNEPVWANEFAATFARLTNRPLRVWQVPSWAAGFVAGRSRTARPLADAVLSNVRLRGIGFRFEFPALEDGILQVLGTLHG